MHSIGTSRQNTGTCRTSASAMTPVSTYCGESHEYKNSDIPVGTEELSTQDSHKQASHMMFPLRSLTAICSLLHFSLALPSFATAESSPQAKIKNGTIEGYHVPAYKQDFFLGVPYAQPPLGPLRYRVPHSLNTSYSNTLNAKAYYPLCVGYGGDDIGYEVSEDCLALNVIRPSGYEGQKLPVAVWIHGGGLQMGGTADRRYNLSFIVDNSVEIGKPMIGVSVGYRLASWGFLYSQEVQGSGQTNLGLRDQRLALHWLQENIEAFGGDASKVRLTSPTLTLFPLTPPR